MLATGYLLCVRSGEVSFASGRVECGRVERKTKVLMVALWCLESQPSQTARGLKDYWMTTYFLCGGFCLFVGAVVVVPCGGYFNEVQK